jgi:hypothetical protein
MLTVVGDEEEDAMEVDADKAAETMVELTWW